MDLNETMWNDRQSSKFIQFIQSIRFWDWSWSGSRSNFSTFYTL